MRPDPVEGGSLLTRGLGRFRGTADPRGAGTPVSRPVAIAVAGAVVPAAWLLDRAEVDPGTSITALAIGYPTTFVAAEVTAIVADRRSNGVLRGVAAGLWAAGGLATVSVGAVALFVASLALTGGPGETTALSRWAGPFAALAPILLSVYVIALGVRILRRSNTSAVVDPRRRPHRPGRRVAAAPARRLDRCQRTRRTVAGHSPAC